MYQPQMYRQTEFSYSPLIKFVEFLIVAAFVVGGLAFGTAQWLNPKIADAIAEIKAQEAAQIALQNQQMAQQVRKDQIDNDQRQALAPLAVVKQKQTDAQDLDFRQGLLNRILDGATLFVNLAAIVIALTLVFSLAPIAMRGRAALLEFLQVIGEILVDKLGPMISQTVNPVQTVYPTESQSGNEIVCRMQMPLETESHREERERARQYELDQRKFKLAKELREVS